MKRREMLKSSMYLAGGIAFSGATQKAYAMRPTPPNHSSVQPINFQRAWHISEECSNCSRGAWSYSHST